MNIINTIYILGGAKLVIFFEATKKVFFGELQPRKLIFPTAELSKRAAWFNHLCKVNIVYINLFNYINNANQELNTTKKLTTKNSSYFLFPLITKTNFPPCAISLCFNSQPSNFLPFSKISFT